MAQQNAASTTPEDFSSDWPTPWRFIRLFALLFLLIIALASFQFLCILSETVFFGKTAIGESTWFFVNPICAVLTYSLAYLLLKEGFGQLPENVSEENEEDGSDPGQEILSEASV